uniref:G-protein coupled receptors family 2 profile 1 domain-containing protein n=1 Tax=Glossina brevipalpis TaxID=37001 RepID=A0A1A9X4T9_9MUSC
MYDNKGRINNTHNNNNNNENVSNSSERAVNKTTFFFTDLLGEVDCIERLNKTTTKFEPGKYCPGTFDGWLCWPDTAAGSTAYERCPDFVTGFEPSSTTIWGTYNDNPYHCIEFTLQNQLVVK